MKIFSLQSVSRWLLFSLVLLSQLVLQHSAVASDWFKLADKPQGKTTQPALQLGKHPLAKNTARLYPPNQQFNLWVNDETYFKPAENDKVEIKKVLQKKNTTRKLNHAVPAIGFQSGVANIPQTYVKKLRQVLAQMKNRSHVRLHFIGHTDSHKLRPALRAKYIDNVGLSRARAQMAAEFFQRQLDLPADSISYDGVGAADPIASNKTAAGRKKNRRVEVQVWYDEVSDVAVEKKVVIPAKKINRLKVCRRETVCKLSYKQGNARRAKLKHLVQPLQYDHLASGLPDSYIQQIREALKNLRDKRHIMLRFVGYTDNLPLTEDEKRIYGDHRHFSAARARYIAQQVQDKLALPNAMISSTGKGMKFPVASNGTGKGRSLNRRVEVEFWYDDPFEQFTAEPQACPDAAGAETITRTYDSPGGPLPVVRFRDGHPVIPPGYIKALQERLAAVKGKANVRLDFIGYTSDKRLNRRTAMVYGDDIGLSVSRARRTMQLVQKKLNLKDKQVMFEGRGYVQSEDVVSTGFIESDSSHVKVKILYDELAVLDDMDGLKVERINRETRPHNPYALNLMRITVDGKPLYDPYKNTEDIQRCTDVALDKANIQFRFNNLLVKPRLNITAWPNTIRYRDNPATAVEENRVSFQMYTNYHAFIKRSEVRVFNFQQSTRSVPVAIVPLDKDGRGSWQANYKKIDGSVKRLVYVLRVYGKNKQFDETVPLPLWVVNKLENSSTTQTASVRKKSRVGIKKAVKSAAEKSLKNTPPDYKPTGNEPWAKSILRKEETLPDDTDLDSLLAEKTPAKKSSVINGKHKAAVDLKKTTSQTKPPVSALTRKEQRVGYGENHLGLENIVIDGGTVTVNGEHIPAGHNVWLAGRKVPLNKDGKFIAEEIFPRGYHTVEVAVLDNDGNGEMFLRDLEFAKNDWFYVGLGDLTLSRDHTTGPARLVTKDENHFNNDINLDARFAYYTEGTFGDDWRLISSADTREAPVDQLFSNFLQKNPRALLRRLDPVLFYPSFADDSTLEERAPTSGKLYLKLQHHNSYGILGNFTIHYLETDLAQIDRGLYGINGHYENSLTTASGEHKFVIDGFAADPGTIAGRDEFRGTGSSLYFLRHQDILIGSDRLRIEVRDKDSGIVLSVKNLVPVLDYDLDYIQGRILLREPLSSLANDNLLIKDSSLSGNPVYLVSRYEYTPGFNDINTLALGGRTHYWINNNIKIGATISKQEEAQTVSKLNGIDLTLRKTTATWLRLELANTSGPGAGALNSTDGGFSFQRQGTGLNPDANSNAYRLAGHAQVDELFAAGKGMASFYLKHRDAGFSAPGQLTSRDSLQFGGTYRAALNKRLNLNVKADSSHQDQALSTQALDVSTTYQASEKWSLSGGLRADKRTDDSTTVAATQKQGNRVDLAVQAKYNANANWTAYGFTQATAVRTANREKNNRIGIGGDVRPTNRLTIKGEASTGNNGAGIKAGTDYLVSDRTNIYTNYTLEDARTDNGLRARRGNWNTGARTRFSDSGSVYGEERYTHGDVPTGLTHAFGIDLAPNDRWNYGANIEMGILKDHQTGAKTDRKALGLNAAYNFGAVVYSAALEYRIDKTQNNDASESKRTTWLMKNTLNYQIDEDWRFVGKADFSRSTSSQGTLFNGNFTEIVAGYGYRPVDNDRLNMLAKYTYFYNVPFGNIQADPLSGQVNGSGAPIDFIQKSHIFSLDAIYDLTRRWSIGGKYAYRLGKVSQDRINQQFFDSTASLYILRGDWHFTNRWDALMEGRLLDLPDAQDRHSGVLLAMYRHVGKNFKIGGGYNFTDFSDDLTDLSYRSQGLFINLVGKI